MKSETQTTNQNNESKNLHLTNFPPLQPLSTRLSKPLSTKSNDPRFFTTLVFSSCFYNEQSENRNQNQTKNFALARCEKSSQISSLNLNDPRKRKFMQKDFSFTHKRFAN